MQSNGDKALGYKWNLTHPFTFYKALEKHQTNSKVSFSLLNASENNGDSQHGVGFKREQHPCLRMSETINCGLKGDRFQELIVQEIVCENRKTIIRNMVVDL